MKLTLFLRAWIGVACLVASASWCQTGRPDDGKLSTASLQKEFVSWFATETKCGAQFFVGAPRASLKRVPQERRLYKYDRNAGSLSPVLSQENETEILNREGKKRSLGSLTVSQDGRWLCASLDLGLPDGSHSSDLAVIDVLKGNVAVLLSDGTRNGCPSFSPNGRFVAFYSSDVHMGWAQSPIKIGEGKILDVGKGSIRTVVEPFECEGDRVAAPAPLWIDDERVLFNTMTTSKALIMERTGNPSIEMCALDALANPETGQVRFLLSPRDLYASSSARVDLPRNRLVLENAHTIQETDLNLERPHILLSAPEGHYYHFYGINDDGSLRYKLYSAEEEKAKMKQAKEAMMAKRTQMKELKAKSNQALESPGTSGTLMPGSR